MTGAVLGIDLGTSGVKAVLVSPDETAGRIAEATFSYPVSTPRSGWSEQDPVDWWAATAQAISAVVQRGVRIEALALSGQMHGAVLLGRSGRVLRPAILWNDQRSGAECDLITDRIGLPHLIKWVANPALAGFTAPKLLWVRRHEPEVYDRIVHVLLPKDYINFRLTGEMASEFSDASGTLLFDVVQRRWSEEMLRALDIPESLLPPVHSSTDIVGRVTPEAARATGLRRGTPVVAGGADNACAAIGMGVVREGQALSSIGTSGTVLAPSAEPRLDPGARLHTFAHAVPDTWYLMGVVLSAGGSLQWLHDVLDDEFPYDALLEEAAGIPAGSEGLIFLPYLSGERTPHGDPMARGVFFGLSLRHRRAHLVRSVVEGVTYALNDSVSIMRQLGIEVGTIRATGGGVRHPLWRQIQADVFNVPIATGVSETGPAIGAAVLAGVGVGIFPSVTAATDHLVKISQQVEANPVANVAYRGYHDLFDSLYPILAPQFKRLVSLRDETVTCGEGRSTFCSARRTI